MTDRFKDEVILVTGASRGIGRAIAGHFGAAGATVIGTATTTEGAANITKAWQQAGFRGRGLALDIADNASVQALEAELRAAAFPTILVNNAGITRDSLLMRMADSDWEAVINTNLSGLYRLSRLCLWPMLKARAGRIINITSVVGLAGNAGQTNYAAAKAGVIGFTRALAKEIGARGITVNAVAPGFIETDMTAGLSAAMREDLLKSIALGRLGRVEEIAAAVAFLASAEAGYITGQTLSVNGGLYMG